MRIPAQETAAHCPVMSQLSPNEKSSPGAINSYASYTDRLAICRKDAARRRRQHVLLGYLRLLWAVAVLAAAWFAFVRHLFAWPWIVLPFVGFAITARFHAKVLAAGARTERAIGWYEHGLARIEDRWAGRRPRPLPPDLQLKVESSLFANDLDLFGPASLFELLCSARTSLGEETLGSFLLEAAPVATVRERQHAVAELRSHLGLRERIASLPGPEVVRLPQLPLLQWAEAPPFLPLALRWLAPLLALLTAAAGLRWLSGHSPLLLLPLLLINATVNFFWQRRLRPLFDEAQHTAAQLGLVAGILEELEHERFTTPGLQALQAALLAGPQSASASLRRLARLSTAIDQRGAVALFNVPLLYSVQLGLLVEAWRQRHGARLAGWFGALGEMEALLSLSAYHFEHPADPFPELLASSGEETRFSAAALGHPLLPATACVRNDVSLDATTRLLLISGSNMSGKSTLLRSVGTAAVMSMAGAPVRASRLRLTALTIAASIQVNDSLQGGRSRFYAEILRLRAVCEIARTHPPVLFLLDELLAGTNSHDRLAGATGIVHALMAANAIGLLSTHDLALTGAGGTDRDGRQTEQQSEQRTEQQSERQTERQAVRNAHFEDRVIDNRLVFDYKLREGVVTRSNGLDLMRLIGLDV